MNSSGDVRVLSVVVASGAGGQFLGRCLESLRDQVTDGCSEVIVVDRCGGSTRAQIERDYAFVNLVAVDQARRASVPELRALGAERARGKIVAILEEHCVAPSGWIQAIRVAFQETDAAIGGPILDDNYARLRDWVVYFSEYHNYLPPWPEGERCLLNGANIAYQRESLLRHKEALHSGYWEVVLHPLLAREGKFRSVPAMGVRHTGPFDYRYYLGQRYLLSRVWGGSQRSKVSAAKRLLYIVGAPVFPFLLLARIAQRVFASRSRVDRFIAALPLLVPVAIAYVWGEWSGYVFGIGDALERVE
jgi:glycosyltransferase involved in cell wall biosynthesis